MVVMVRPGGIRTHDSDKIPSAQPLGYGGDLIKESTDLKNI